MGQSDKVTRREILESMSAKSGLSLAESHRAYDSFVDSIVDAVLAGKYVSLTGFGNFYLQVHKGHPVQFERDSTSVPDYALLKYSASDIINQRLRN